MNEQKNNEFWLAKWLNNDLTKEELEKFKASNDYETYIKIKTYSGFLQVPQNDLKASWESVANKTIHHEKKQNYSWVIGIAASILLCLGWFFGLKSNDLNVSTNFGEHLTVFLPDSSEVILNGNSKLDYNLSNWKKEKRLVNLKGEAFFKVKKGSLFTVKTAEGNINVLGTQFNVNSHANSLEVKCYEGKVKVYKNEKEALLTKGKAYRILNNKGEHWPLKPEEKLWFNNENTFYNAPLSKVFSSLENQFNISIVNKESHLNRRFTGSFSNNSKTIAIKTVLTAMNINYEIDKSIIVILN